MKTRIAAMMVMVCLLLTCIVIPVRAATNQEQDFASAEVDDIVIFGHYEQDNVGYNGKEPIERIVLAKTEDKVLLISRYALTGREYNDRNIAITWKDSTMRKWLNSTFLKDAFTAEEQKRILTTTVSADKNPKTGRSAGKDTKDQIFLLSAKEAKIFFDSKASRQCEVTAYAKAQHCYTRNGYCWWWLRTPGQAGYSVAAVKNYGELLYTGYAAHISLRDGGKYGGVRPAMWIDISNG